MPSIIPLALGALALLALFGGTAKASEQKPQGQPQPSPTPTPTPGATGVTMPANATAWPVATVTLTPLQTAAQNMVEHLKQVQVQAGSVTAAKGKENKAIVSSFQAKAGLSQDGKAGPGTLAAAAANGQTVLPLVMYWPSGAGTQRVYEYRATLYEIADKLVPTKAQELRSSAERERGQAGVAGGPIKE